MWQSLTALGAVYEAVNKFAEQKIGCGKAEINMDGFESKRDVLPASARDCGL